MVLTAGFAGPVHLSTIVEAASFLAAGLLLGWLAERLTAGRMKRWAETTSWGGDDIVVAGARGVIQVWIGVAGAYAAISALPLRRGLHDALARLLLALIVVSLTVAIARIATNAIRLYALRTTKTMHSSSIFVNLSRIIIGLIGALVLLESLGVSIGPLLAALGVGGLAVALALQDTLANFFAGLQIIATKKIKPGDFVRLETGEQGYVADIDWRHTSIRQLPNNMVLVPNSKIANSVLTNFYYPEQEMSVLVEAGVSYASDLGRVERVTIDTAKEVLREVAGGVTTFDPFIRYHTFNDSSIDFTVILRAREFTDQYLLKHEFIKRLHERYAREGIVIPFPIRTVELPASRSGPRADAP